MRNDNRGVGRSLRRLAACGVALCVPLVAAPTALGAVEWGAEISHAPQNLSPGNPGMFVVIPRNLGTTASDSRYTVRIDLPAGVTATSAGGKTANGNSPTIVWNCAGVGTGSLTCSYNSLGILPAVAPITDPTPSARGTGTPIFVSVDVAPGASGVSDVTVTLPDGGAMTPSVVTERTPIGATPAGFGFVEGSFTSDVFDARAPYGNTVRQAGSHPFEARVEFKTNLRYREDSAEVDPYTDPDGRVKVLQVRMPRGFIGNPEATPKCEGSSLQDIGPANNGGCPPETQVGTVDLLVNSLDQVAGTNDNVAATQALPIWNMKPSRGAIASLAFQLMGQPVYINVTLDPRDYSIIATIDRTNASLPVRSARLALWGVPGDPAHDYRRLDPRKPTAYGVGVTGPIRPFLTLPSQCGVDGWTEATANSWADPATWTPVQRSAAAQVTGCDDARFDFRPTLRFQPTATTPNTPTGATVVLSVPQKDDAVDPADVADLYEGGTDKAIGTPPLKDAKVLLPEGMTVSPSSADGLASCTPGQIKLRTNDEPTCPDASKIGSVTVDTPLLADPLEGGIYLAQQNVNPFNSLLALYLVAEGSNVMLKLPGKIAPDPTTGQLTASFDENPQLPFTSLTLKFKDGPRAPLVTPPTCGVKTVSSQLSSWNGSIPTVTTSDTFTIDGNCNLGFDPSFSGGTTDLTAGGDAAVKVRFGRGDRDEELSNIDVTMPDGLLGRIASSTSAARRRPRPAPAERALASVP